MKRTARLAACLAVGIMAAGTQQVAAQQTADRQTSDRSNDWLIAAAVLAAPANLREGAEVRAWTAGGELVVLRPGTNELVCLAGRPDEAGFSAACYHSGLEPFMARGRELIRQGVEGARRDQIRWQEIEAGTLPMPAMAMVYNFRLPTMDFDPAVVDVTTATRLHALYIPGATAASTGLSPLPSDEPWLMLPGTPSAHVMIALPRKQ